MPDIKTTLARDIEAETLDIRFTITLPGGSKTKTIINIEAQRKNNPGYSLLNRGIFYAAGLSQPRYPWSLPMTALTQPSMTISRMSTSSGMD